MSDSHDRLEELSRRAARERETLASAPWETRLEVSAFSQRWRYAGLAASGLAAAGTAAWKLFGRNSLAAKAGKIASAASLLTGPGRPSRPPLLVSRDRSAVTGRPTPQLPTWSILSAMSR